MAYKLPSQIHNNQKQGAAGGGAHGLHAIARLAHVLRWGRGGGGYRQTTHFPAIDNTFFEGRTHFIIVLYIKGTVRTVICLGRAYPFPTKETNFDKKQHKVVVQQYRPPGAMVVSSAAQRAVRYGDAPPTTRSKTHTQ